MGTYSQLVQLSQSPTAPHEQTRPEVVTPPPDPTAALPTTSFSEKASETETVLPKQSPLPISPRPVDLAERTEFRTEMRSEKRTVTLPYKRRTKRYSFEFYEDQLIVLKRLKYEAEMTGERVNLSDFAREALDEYLKAKGLL